jgi:hypothetical protein
MGDIFWILRWERFHIWRLPSKRTQIRPPGDTMAASSKHLLRRLIPHAALIPMALVVIVGYLGTVLWSLNTSFTNARTFPTGT